MYHNYISSNHLILLSQQFKYEIRHRLRASSPKLPFFIYMFTALKGYQFYFYLDNAQAGIKWADEWGQKNMSMK